MIRLGQLLQAAGFVDSGGEAKALLATGSVHVNGEREERRGRQLHARRRGHRRRGVGPDHLTVRQLDAEPHDQQRRAQHRQ